MSLKGLLRELRRRRTFRTAGFYIVGAWLVMQAADVFFPAWGLPDAAINVLLASAILGFPLVLVFGWFYDVSAAGIVRTPAADTTDAHTPLPLKRKDYALLGALALIAAYIVYDGAQEIVRAPRIEATGPTADLAAPERIEHSVAVLPFANTSNDPENEAFCDGISEEILHKLSGYAELHVIGRTSSFAFKNSDYRIPRIAALLGVRYLLQGSVRRDGDNLRILAALVDEAGVQKWSASYDRKLESVFAIQDEIADVVATNVAPHVGSRRTSGYEPDLAAYQQYLVGRELLWRRDLGAPDALLKATQLDPNFAEAYADLAISLLIGPPDLQGARQAIDTALSLQPGLPRALAARGLFLQQRTPPDYAASEQVLREALSGMPDMVDAMNWLSTALAVQGRHDEALRVRERAARIDPLHGPVVSNLARRYANLGKLAKAEQMLSRLTEVPEPSRVAFITLRDLYLDTGQLVKMNALEKRQALEGLHVYYGLALNYALLGLLDEAERWVNLTMEDFPNFSYIALYPALMPFWQGDYAEAAESFPADEQTLERLYPTADYIYGQYQALAGDFDGAAATLAPLFEQADTSVTDEWLMIGLHALAWARQETGRNEAALRMLGEAERAYALEEAAGRLNLGSHLFVYARNALLLGDHDTALDRLERAVDAGWRQYLIHQHDRRWAPLHDHPRYVALIQHVVDDIERQRAEVERIDAESDFIERFEAAHRLR